MRGDVKHEVYKALDSMSHAQTIRGGAFSDKIASRLGRTIYPTVVLKYAKYWAFLSGGAFDCVDYARSVYRFEPGKNTVAGTYWETMPVKSVVKEYKAKRGKA